MSKGSKVAGVGSLKPSLKETVFLASALAIAPVALGLLAQAFPPTWIRDVGLGFYSAATQIIPVFFIALLVELLALGGHIKPLGQRVADTIDVGTKARDRSGRTVEDLQELSTGLEAERNQLDADIEKARELWDERADLDRRASELRMKARQSEEGPQPDDAASGGLDEARRIRDEGNRLAGKMADLQREVTEREDKARETQREGDSVLEDAGKLVPDIWGLSVRARVMVLGTATPGLLGLAASLGALALNDGTPFIFAMTTVGMIAMALGLLYAFLRRFEVPVRPARPARSAREAAGADSDEG